MKPDQALVLIGLGALWLLAVVPSRSRTWPMVGVMAAATSLAIAAVMQETVLGSFVAVGAAALAAVAILWPSRLGVGALTPADQVADGIFRRLEGGIDEAGPHVDSGLIAKLETLASAPPRDPWAIAGRLYRRYLARQLTPDAVDRPNEPSTAFRTAARHYWDVALWRRVIGQRRRPTVYDEDVLLRCLAREFENVLTGRHQNLPLEPSGDLATKAQRILADLRACSLVNPIADELRQLQLDVMEVELAIAAGDRSTETLKRRSRVLREAEAGWSRMGTTGHA